MSRLTVKDLLDGKGTCQRTFVQVTSAEQAAAAEDAGIEMISARYLPENRSIPAAAPGTWFQFSLPYGRHASSEEALRDAFRALEDGAVAIYSAMSPRFIEPLAREGIPVTGHVGLVPPTSTWVGGLRGVGRRADQAIDVYRRAQAFEAAGAFAVEIECVAHRVAGEIARRSSMFTISLGSGNGCDAQYLFSADILGEADRIPRHARAYRDFRANYAHLQRERVAAYREFSRDVRDGAFPATGHLLDMAEPEFERFLDAIE